MGKGYEYSKAAKRQSPGIQKEIADMEKKSVPKKKKKKKKTTLLEKTKKRLKKAFKGY
jgi:hypothetical protein